MLVLDMLSRHMGRARFHAALRRMMAESPFRTQTWSDVQRRLSQFANEDLSWFFSQWVDRPGAPELAIEWQQNGETITGEIRQVGEAYRLTVPLTLHTAAGPRVNHHVVVTSSTTSFRFEAVGDIERIELDPDNTVLRSTPDLRAMAEALVPLTKVQGGASGEDAYKAFDLILTQSRGRPNDPLGVRFLGRMGIARLNASDGKWAEAVANYRAALAEPNARVDAFPWIYIRLATAAQRAGDRKAEVWALNEALAIARSGPPSALGDEAALRLARLSA